MRIAVIGGGYTGCMAAFHAKALGAQVSLYEVDSELGGVLRDVVINGKKFFNACQYLRDQADGLDEWNISESMVRFEHQYGSLTRLSNKRVRLMDDCAQPVLDGEAILSKNPVVNQSAMERLLAYGSPSTDLIRWASGFGNLSQLDYRCLVPMQLSRVYFAEDPSLGEKKQKDPLADQLLALPRKLRAPNAAIEPAFLPSEGFNQFFARFKETLLDVGVGVYTDSPVKLHRDEEVITLTCRGDKVEVDKIVWAANPTPLLSRIFNVKLKTPPIPMKLIVGEFDTPLPFTPYYWQIFDADISVTRVYVYELSGRPCFSVETFAGDSDEKILADVRSVFKQLPLPSRYTVVGIENQHRHVNFSSEELQAIESASSNLPSMGIVPGGWTQYGREEKVQSLKCKISEAMR